MDSFILGPTPKIDFTQTLDHTLAPAWELANLWFSLNTFSKHYRIHHRILYKTQTRPLFIGFKRLQKLIRFGLCLSSVRMDFCDILQKQCNSILIRFASRWLDIESGQSSLKSFPRLNRNLELSELLDIVRMWYRVVQTVCKYWTLSGLVAESSGQIAETSQTVSISENRLLVEYWLTERLDSVALMSRCL
jgi:hypothetical protein